MNINFKTHFPWPGPTGKPERTNFDHKISACVEFPDDPQGWTPKKHTIRRFHGKPRFREGMELTFSSGSRFKPVRFGHALCTGTQFLRMEAAPYAGGISLGVWLQEPAVLFPVMKLDNMERLALNDGLSMENFLKWFLLDVLTHGTGHYQIVHWTDLRY